MGAARAVVAIAGVHRSGTSMVTQILRDCGLAIGRDEDLMPPTSDNPRGYWEHLGFVQINKDVLEQVRGTWDAAPRVPVAKWSRLPSLAGVRDRARRLIAAFDGQLYWGWKDPRNTFTLPFWLDLIPDLKVVVCLRHPVEVHRSLLVRRHSSHARGLRLWRVFNEFMLAHTRPEQRIVTHYESYFRSPHHEVSRVLAFIGMPAVPADASFPAITGELRHQVHSDTGARSVRVPAAVLALYHRLLAEAEAPAPDI